MHIVYIQTKFRMSYKKELLIIVVNDQGVFFIYFWEIIEAIILKENWQ